MEAIEWNPQADDPTITSEEAEDNARLVGTVEANAVHSVVISIKNRVVFRRQLENLSEASLGSSADCDIVLEDETCSDLAAKIIAREKADNQISLCFYPIMKVYYVVSKPVPLYYQTVFKLNDVCLQATDLNTDSIRDNTRFDKYRNTAEGGNNGDSCYVCWSLKPDSDPGGLIRSPCGYCTGRVHLSCLLKWVEHRKTGHCPICRGVLPDDFSAAPPCLELTVVNEANFRSNSGIRLNVLRLSFAKQECSYLATQQDGIIASEKRIAQAFVRFNLEKERFELASLGRAETLVIQKSAFEIFSGESKELKLGRTIITVEVQNNEKGSKDILEDP